MKIVIVGCGRAGSRLAGIISSNGHDVSIIDREPLAFDKLPADFSGKIIHGTGIDQDVLIKAGIETADVFLSVAKGDNTNIMAGQIAKFIFKVPKVLVRIVDPRSKEFYSKIIKLDCYCPTEVSCKYYIEYIGGIV